MENGQGVSRYAIRQDVFSLIGLVDKYLCAIGALQNAMSRPTPRNALPILIGIALLTVFRGTRRRPWLPCWKPGNRLPSLLTTSAKSRRFVSIIERCRRL